MSANLITKPPVPNFEAWRMCAQVTSLRQSEFVDTALLFAICTRATNCKATMCKMDPQYLRHLHEIVKCADVHAVEWLKRATIWEGGLRGRVARYRYLPHMRPIADSMLNGTDEGHLTAVMLACSWGIAQEPGVRVVQDVEVHLRRKTLEAYIARPETQLLSLLDRLHCLIRENYKSEREGLVKFYKDFSDRSEVEAANRTFDLAQFFRSDDWRLATRQVS
ncbi:MAG: hypothetical protein EKK48_30195 [Candidatus Melainabacteria bacterium]|nr:MAG: hypothetical protein EKK48_30195 [Candidatus Melainabacteria bacterium]